MMTIMTLMKIYMRITIISMMTITLTLPTTIIADLEDIETDITETIMLDSITIQQHTIGAIHAVE